MAPLAPPVSPALGEWNCNYKKRKVGLIDLFAYLVPKVDQSCQVVEGKDITDSQRNRTFESLDACESQSLSVSMKTVLVTTLVVLIFAGTNFCAFRGFCPKSWKFVPRNTMFCRKLLKTAWKQKRLRKMSVHLQKLVPTKYKFFRKNITAKINTSEN